MNAVSRSFREEGARGVTGSHQSGREGGVDPVVVTGREIDGDVAAVPERGRVLGGAQKLLRGIRKPLGLQQGPLVQRPQRAQHAVHGRNHLGRIVRPRPGTRPEPSHEQGLVKVYDTPPSTVREWVDRVKTSMGMVNSGK